MNGFVSAQALKPKQRSDLSVLGTGRQHATSVRARFVGVQRRLHLDEHILLTSCTCQDEGNFLFIVFKQKKQPKYYLVLTVQIFGIEPPLSLELELRQHMSWVPKAIIIISADGQNQRVICNIMNAPIPNFSWSFDIFCDWSSSSCKLHLHNLF